MPRFTEVIQNNCWGSYLDDAQGVNSYRAAVLSLLDKVYQLQTALDQVDPSLSNSNPYVEAHKRLREFGIRSSGDKRHWYSDMTEFLSSYANNWARANRSHQADLN